MIATHNIKVNGKWYSAGQEVPEPEEKKTAEEVTASTEAVNTPEVESPRSKTTRRKKASE